MAEERDEAILSIRMPRALRRQVKARAALLGISVQEVVVSLLEGWLQQTESAARQAQKLHPEE